MTQTKNALSKLHLDDLTASAVDKQLKTQRPVTNPAPSTKKKPTKPVKGKTDKTSKDIEGKSNLKTNVSIQIHVDLRKRLKRMCLEEEVGIQAYVEKLLDDALKKKGY